MRRWSFISVLGTPPWKKEQPNQLKHLIIGPQLPSFRIGTVQPVSLTLPQSSCYGTVQPVSLTLPQSSCYDTVQPVSLTLPQSSCYDTVQPVSLTSHCHSHHAMTQFNQSASHWYSHHAMTQFNHSASHCHSLHAMTQFIRSISLPLSFCYNTNSASQSHTAAILLQWQCDLGLDYLRFPSIWPRLTGREMSGINIFSDQS